LNKLRIKIEGYIEELTSLSSKSDNELLHGLLSLLIELREYVPTENTSELWEEFIKIYPSKTPNGRRLYTNLEKTAKKYESIVKNNRILHEKILILLNKDLEDRRSTNSLNYLPQISKYVNQKLWEAYDVEDDREEGKGRSNFEIL
jgi:hypothetical protein